MLFPLRLDDSVFDLDAHWATQIRQTRNIGAMLRLEVTMVELRRWRSMTMS